MKHFSALVATVVLCSVFGTSLQKCDYDCKRGGHKVCYLNGTRAGDNRCRYNVKVVQANGQLSRIRPCDCGIDECRKRDLYPVCNEYNELIANQSTICLQNVEYCLRGEVAPDLYQCITDCAKIVCTVCDVNRPKRVCYENGQEVTDCSCEYKKMVCRGEAKLGATTKNCPPKCGCGHE